MLPLLNNCPVRATAAIVRPLRQDGISACLQRKTAGIGVFSIIKADVALLSKTDTLFAMKKSISGRCLCGAVTYRADGPPIVVAQCHCEECRRLSGTGHTVGAMFHISNVTVNGQLGRYSYTSNNGSEVTKSFCPGCGSPIWGQNTRLPDHLTLTLGTMDNTADLEVQVVIFDQEKRHWDQLGADIVTFAGQPDWKPGN